MTSQGLTEGAPAAGGRTRERAAQPVRWARGTLGRRLSVRWKLTLWYALVYLLTLVVIGITFPAVLNLQTGSTVDTSLHNTANRLLGYFAGPVTRDAAITCPYSQSQPICRYLNKLQNELNSYGVRLSAPGQFVQVQTLIPGVVTSPTLNPKYLPAIGLDPGLMLSVLGGGPHFTRITYHGEHLRVYAVRLDVPPALAAQHVAGVLEVFQVEHTYVEVQHAILVIILFGIPIGLLLAIIVGWWVARVALRPIGRISRAVQRVGESQDLTRRLHYVGPTDELSRLADTFDGMMDRLESVFITQRRFIGDASHELRTPLTAIRGNADLLSIAPPDERDICITSIQREAQRMSRLIGDLLLLAEADVAETAIHLQPVYLDDILADVYRSTALLAGDKLTVRSGPLEPLEVMGDPDRLKQLFLNLADNAVKFTPPGGLVSISLRAEDGQAVAKVADNGAGIPVEQQDAIFRRFYRVESSRSTRGSGLGLAICASIAQAHGGTIDVRGKPGQGSTFTVRLPLSNTPE